MDGAIFRVRSEAKERMLKEFSTIEFTKNEVGGYAYNDANTLVVEIERLLGEQLFEDTTDGMKGLASTSKNTLNGYKGNIAIRRKDVLIAAQAEADRLNALAGGTSAIQPEFATNTDAQEEADRLNSYRLSAIGVKEGTAAAITKIVGKDITNPILRSADGTSFKSVDEYQLHQLITAITEGAERPEATTIRKQFVSIAGTVFDWRDTMVINVEKFATKAAKAQGYGIRVHDDLKAIVILANVEWAAQQSWGAEISVAQHKIVATYRYDHTHDKDSIRNILKILAGADEARDRRKATAPGGAADMVSQGMERLQLLVQQQPSFSSDSSSATESAYYTSDSDDGGKSRGRSKSRKSKSSKKSARRSHSPSTSRSPTPPPVTDRSKSRGRSKSTGGKKKDDRERNPTGCKYCKKYGGSGFVHAAPKKIPHEKCNFNKKYKGYRPQWVCDKMDIEFKEWSEFDD